MTCILTSIACKECDFSYRLIGIADEQPSLRSIFRLLRVGGSADWSEISGINVATVPLVCSSKLVSGRYRTMEFDVGLRRI
jgi:hypothetical protein